MVGDEKVGSGLVNPKVNMRTLLAVFWICHFILWIFGDMFTLLQDMGEPATDTSIQFLAPTTAIVLTLMVVLCLVGRPTYARLANLIMAPCTWCSTLCSSSTPHRAGSTTWGPFTYCSTS